MRSPIEFFLKILFLCAHKLPQGYAVKALDELLDFSELGTEALGVYLFLTL